MANYDLRSIFALPAPLCRFTTLLCATVCALATEAQETIAEPIEVGGRLVRFVIDPTRGGTLIRFGFVEDGKNIAGAGGLLQEGFGTGSSYTPNRQRNQRLEIIAADSDQPAFRFTYDCEGSNIEGLRVVRTLEMASDEASVRVTWEIENAGELTHWVAPWVRHAVAPGGSIGEEDRIDLPTTTGVVQPSRTSYYPAARNWAAVTDAVAKETVYGAFDASQTHSFLAVRDVDRGELGFGAHFVPFLMKPGDTWRTVYRVGAVRGLGQVDFASEELCAEIHYGEGELEVLLSPAAAFPETILRAAVLGTNDQSWPLVRKRFTAMPDKLVRCTYEWNPPNPGYYEFLAQFRLNDEPFELGRATNPPHGGIDTQFRVGDPAPTEFAAWTDAPHALERKPRRLERKMAVESDTAVWFESSLRKIYPDDIPVRLDGLQTTHSIEAAANEAESFQVVVCPPDGEPWNHLQISIGALTNRARNTVIPASTIQSYRVGYVPVTVPSRFEHLTGLYPDPLLPTEALDVPGGKCATFWVTVAVPADAPPGEYEGSITLTATDREDVALTLLVDVHPFQLPRRPTLKTDFGFDAELAYENSVRMGYGESKELLRFLYAQNALDHRVTLRDLNQFPTPTDGYESRLSDFTTGIPKLLAAGATTLVVPETLIETPENLAAVNALVERQSLSEAVFAPFAPSPRYPTPGALATAIRRWQTIAPSIPALVKARDTAAPLPTEADIWLLHLPMLTTQDGTGLREAIRGGQEAWWYVDHYPGLPYGNFFLEYDGIDHRILFWQTWAVGFSGMHYWSVNRADNDIPSDPYRSLLDSTPANGDGVLLYPGPNGPVNSIRWEIIRDGIEDYDYLTLLSDRVRQLRERGSDEHAALVDEAIELLTFERLAPSLVEYTLDSVNLERKRSAVAAMIVRLDNLLAD